VIQDEADEEEKEGDQESDESDDGFIPFSSRKSIPIHNKRINKNARSKKKTVLDNMEVVALNAMDPLGEEAMTNSVKCFHDSLLARNRRHRIPTLLLASQKRTVRER